MRIGVDFDNTIVCFDPLFRLAAAQKKLIPGRIGSSKTNVRNYLQSIGRNDVWTQLQGYVYGDLIRRAQPFPGVKDFFAKAHAAGHELFIVSHKTKKSAIAPVYELHKPAKKWLIDQGFYKNTGLKPSHVFFETSMKGKMQRLEKLKCDYIIDDLLEFLTHPNFPANIKRILFDPNKQHADCTLYRVSSWDQLLQGILPHLTPLFGGGNNRGFRVDTLSEKLFLKVYYHHPADNRNRLRTEFDFCTFIWEQGLRSVPKPLAKDEKNHLGLYEYIEGRLLTEKDVTKERVKEAVKFFLDFNKRRHGQSASRLPTASEACFTMNDHLLMVRDRLARLKKIKNESSAHREARDFVSRKLEPAWQIIESNVRLGAQEMELSLKKPLSQKERCLSPSDFGFHNAILTPKGFLRFIDFEYAGWDDIAKTICDFSLQPRLPFSQKLLPFFSQPLLKFFGNEDFHRARIQLLYPVFAFKWCCIMLNVFLRGADQKKLREQLKKSEKYLIRACSPIPKI